jgi:molybdenum cofactor cytidylyltransferase
MSAEGLNVAAVLLAAGLSRRMGDINKLLIEINGEPLVRRTAKVYLEAGTAVHVVLGHEAERVRAALSDLPVTFVQNPDYAEGQPTSVRAGLDSLPGLHDLMLVALADQIALTPEDILDLVRTFAKGDRHRILIPYYGGERGNPVAFPSTLLAEVRASGANAASRAFIDGHPDLTAHYEAPNNHFTTDIDTPEDLARFKRGLGSDQV